MTMMRRHIVLAAAALACAPVLAGPRAHGPNGEHLDGNPTTAGSSALPRLEAKSESFELVATLHGSELSVLVDRFETNEPVLNAQLEVETTGRKARATFHADHGDYAVDDPAFLHVLATPGEHALVFTLVAGKDADLLDGTLVVAPNATHADLGHGRGYEDHDHGLERTAWIGGGVAALGLAGAAAWWLRRRAAVNAQKGVQP
jgi:hypothetical protein